MLRLVEETVVGQWLRRVEVRQLTPYGASGTLGRRPQAPWGRSRRDRRRKGKKRRGGCRGEGCNAGCISTAGGRGGRGRNIYMDEKGGRFRYTKAARPTGRGAWPDLVSAPFSPRLGIIRGTLVRGNRALELSFTGRQPVTRQSFSALAARNFSESTSIILCINLNLNAPSPRPPAPTTLRPSGRILEYLI
jgi:hypothetical protein